MRRPLRPALLLLVAALPAAAHAQDPAFDAPVVVASAFDRFGCVLDLDGDGFDDAVSWWWVDELAEQVAIRSWTNDGTGALERDSNHEQIDLTGSTPALDSWGEMGRLELDGDGLDDFFLRIEGADGGQVDVFRAVDVGGDPSAQKFERVPAYSASSAQGFSAAVFADFDGDGLTDRALATGTEIAITRFVDRGSGPVPGATRRLDLLSPIDALLLLDANGIDPPDLFANGAGVGHVVEVTNGFPILLSSHSHGIALMPMPAAGDIDGDLDEDVVVFGFSEYVVLRHLPGGFDTEPAIANGGPATHLYDVDGDGDLDGLGCGGGTCGCCGSCPAENTQLSTFLVSQNDGSGLFAPGWPTPGLGSLRLAGASDLDHDGDLDLVAGRCVYYPDGALEQPSLPLLLDEQFATSVVDVDRDGDPDHSVRRSELGFNLGDGSTAVRDPYLAITIPGQRLEGEGFPGDFDGDGDADLVVRLVSERDGSFVHMRLLRNNGGGGFVDGGPAGPQGISFDVEGGQHSTTAAACVVGDADGDGDLDLFTRRLDDALVPLSRTWLNDSRGFFTLGPELPTRTTILAVSDIDGDSLPDFFMQNSLDEAALYWGTGGAGYDPNPRRFYGGTTMAIRAPNDRFVIEDIDLDGDLDLAAIDGFRGAEAQVFLQGPARSFATWYALPGALEFTGFDVGRYVQRIDVDVDGLPDWILAPARFAPNAARIVRRAPDDSGWLEPETQVLFQSEPSGGAPADADGDGDLDLYIEHLIRNRRFRAPLAGARVQIGIGAPAADGTRPTLGASGPFRVGEQLVLRLSSAPAQTVGKLLVRLASVGAAPFEAGGLTVPAGVLVARHALATGGNPQVPGSGAWTLEQTVPLADVGRTYVLQAILIDPVLGTETVASNELRLSFGP